MPDPRYDNNTEAQNGRVASMFRDALRHDYEAAAHTLAEQIDADIVERMSSVFRTHLVVDAPAVLAQPVLLAIARAQPIAHAAVPPQEFYLCGTRFIVTDAVPFGTLRAYTDEEFSAAKRDLARRVHAQVYASLVFGR